MKNSKRAAVLILAVVMMFLLTACGNSLRGVYVSEDGVYHLALGEDKMTISDGYNRNSGSYTVKGDQLTHTFTDPFGYEGSSTYTVLQKGDKLVLTTSDGIGITFNRTGGGKSGGSAGTVILVLVIVAALAAAAVLLKKKAPTGSARRPSKEEVKETVQRASRTVAASAAEVGSKAAKTAAEVSSRAARKAQDISAAASARAAAGAEPKRPARQDDVQQIPLNEDVCCICGRSLADGAITLGGLPEGKKAWIDQSCVAKLQALGQPKDEESFESAARFMKGQVRYVDPDVGAALRRFIRKAEERYYYNG